MKRQEINIRDPFVLPYEGKYYLYGTRSASCWGEMDGFDCYISGDLEEWEGPIEIFHNDGSFWATESYWAPECVFYRGAFYLISTFGAKTRKKGVQILRADRPEGPFVPISDGPVTPAEWNCIDGTLYVEEDTPWLVFSHSVPEEPRGAMCALPLTADLSAPAGEPVILFYADEAPWAKPFPWAKEEFGMDGPMYFSDGAYLYRGEDGGLLMLWSSWGTVGYSVGVARSATGRLEGPWVQAEEDIFRDGGHGMIFRTFEGKRCLALHHPNDRTREHPVFLELNPAGDGLLP